MQRAEHLIIGGGVAGTVAAETIRAKQPDARIVIVSAEDYPLYSRVLLPNYVKGKVAREKVFLRQWPQYEAKKIEVLRGRRMVSFDAAAHTATLDDGATWEYGTLLLATGGEAKSPFPDDPAIIPFRTLDDADRIREAIARIAARPAGERRAAVVGGGFIALEFPPFLEPHGIETHLLMRGPRYWHRTVTEGGSARIERTMTERGVILRKDTAIADVRRSGEQLVLTLNDGGTLALDALFVGVGLNCVPRCAASAGLAVGSGITANEHLETNLPDVWAAGDGAEFLDVTSGTHKLLGNWMNADLQGRCAGENMSGARRAFDNVTQYSTRIFDTVIAMAGDRPADAAPRVVTDDARHLELYERDGALIGAVMIGLVPERSAILTAIKNKQQSPV